MDFKNTFDEYYRTYAAVDLDAIAHNLTELKKKIKKDVLSLAIVKADAYGHGAVGVARAIQNDVDYFGIAELGEAVELRGAGVEKPILVLSYTSPYQYETLVKHELTQTIFNYDDAVALSEAAVKLKKIARVHIAVDTGMSRIGFFCNNESVETVKRINDLPNIYIEGIFSHYACADCVERETTRKQTEVFKNFINELENRGMYIPIKHMCNSAGLLTVDEQFNMVRLGIVMYGLYPDEYVNDGSVDLVPAMRIVSHVSHVKEVPAGSGVSYGHTYFTDKPTRIATVCIGYADGYSRSLSNKGRVIINGEYAPVIGRVCMDQLMVDVTGLSSVSVGDEVTVLGTDGENSITAEEIAELTDTINYEVVCQFQKRVTILHYKNNKRIV
ncbi:MAG: alanine racemase [Clostridia bacterium]|nr:alanine racemase [Clostridia bacterium]